MKTMQELIKDGWFFQRKRKYWEATHPNGHNYVSRSLDRLVVLVNNHPMYQKMYTVIIKGRTSNYDEKVSLTREFDTQSELLRGTIQIINQTHPDVNFFEVEIPELNYMFSGYINEVKNDLIFNRTRVLK